MSSSISFPPFMRLISLLSHNRSFRSSRHIGRRAADMNLGMERERPNGWAVLLPRRARPGGDLAAFHVTEDRRWYHARLSGNIIFLTLNNVFEIPASTSRGGFHSSSIRL